MDHRGTPAAEGQLLGSVKFQLTLMSFYVTTAHFALAKVTRAKCQHCFKLLFACHM